MRFSELEGQQVTIKFDRAPDLEGTLLEIRPSGMLFKIDSEDLEVQSSEILFLSSAMPFKMIIAQSDR